MNSLIDEPRPATVLLLPAIAADRGGRGAVGGGNCGTVDVPQPQAQALMEHFSAAYPAVRLRNIEFAVGEEMAAL